MLLSVITLLVIGLLMVYSASWRYSLVELKKPVGYLVIKQLIFVIVGGAGAFLLSRIDYHYFKKWVVPGMIATMGLLVVVRILGDARLGAIRALSGGSMQPSELAKLMVIVYLAFWLFSKHDQLHNINFGLIPIIVILGLTAGLVLLQPDLSAAATIIALGGLLFYLAGGEMRQIIPIVIISALIGVLVINISSTGRTRMTDYINGLRNPEEASFHVKRSLEAVINGGLFGVGLGNSEAKQTGMPFAPTDSIFAIIAEELGLLGAAGVIALYLIMLWRGLKIAQNAPDELGRLLAAGLTFWILIEAIINMGMMVNLVPFAGNAMPMVSAGGSNMIVNLAAIGIIFNVASQGQPQAASAEGRLFGAVVDLRRRDRRRRVPRSGRVESSEE